MIGRYPFELSYGHGLVQFKAPAAFFATMRTNATEDTGEGKVLHDYFHSFPVLSLFDHSYIALNVQTGGAGQAAGSFVHFVNGKGSGYGLGILFVSRFLYRKIFVILVGKIDRANFCAFPAACTFGKIDKTRVVLQTGHKASLIAFKIENFRVG
jgi:hypothetical protein